MTRFSPLLFLVLLAGCGDPAPVTVPEPGELKKLAPGSHRETADVPGVGKINYAIDVPGHYDGTTPVPLVLVLHYGYDGAKPKPYTGGEMIQDFRHGLADMNAIVIGPDVVGGDWKSTNNEIAAVWLTKSAMKTYKIDPKKVLITGLSMGGEGTLYIGSRHQDIFTAAIPVAAPVAGGTDWKIPICFVHSSNDEVVSHSRAKSHADAIKAKGGTVEFKSVSGLKHYASNQYNGPLKEAVTWVQGNWK
jgi:predicted peptidase